MNGKVKDYNADEVVLHYERAQTKGETKHAEKIREAHPDLSKRFSDVDARLAAV